MLIASQKIKTTNQHLKRLKQPFSISKDKANQSASQKLYL
jgi:hypothetical protein